MAQLAGSVKWGDLKLSDETRDALASEFLERQVQSVLSNLSMRISRLGADEYPSCSFFTPQRNPHVAYANGAVKKEGEAIFPVKCENFSDAAKVAAFASAAAMTYDAIVADKPYGRDRLIMRTAPDASLILKPDGLYVTIYVRLGWDKIEPSA